MELPERLCEQQGNAIVLKGWKVVERNPRQATKFLLMSVFSYFFSFSGSSVKISSVSSGQVVSELTASPDSSHGQQALRFTSAVINPQNAFQLITSTLEGRILIWDFLNAVILRDIDVGKPIHYICAHKTLKDTIFVSASLNKKKSQGELPIP